MVAEKGFGGRDGPAGPTEGLGSLGDGAVVTFVENAEGLAADEVGDRGLGVGQA